MHPLFRYLTPLAFLLAAAAPARAATPTLPAGGAPASARAAASASGAPALAPRAEVPAGGAVTSMPRTGAATSGAPAASVPRVGRAEGSAPAASPPRGAEPPPPAGAAGGAAPTATGAAAASPQPAARAPLVTAPAAAPTAWIGPFALDAGLAGAGAGLVWGLASTDQARGALAGSGAIGALGVLAAGAIVPPLAPAAVRAEPGLLASGFAGSLLGLALGSALSAGMRDPASPGSPLAIAGVFALSQGLGTALAREAYRRFGAQDPSLGVLDPDRRDDAVLDWNAQRARRQP